MKQENDNSRLKQTLARIALVLMAVFIIGACVCMVIGNRELMMAALFCLVFVPIIIYCFIMVYDMTYGKSKREREQAGLDGDGEDEEGSTDLEEDNS